MQTFSVKSLILLFSIAIIFSCKDAKKEEISKLETEVMEIHDAIMPQMNEIHNLRKELKAALENLKDSTEVFAILDDLSKADSAMLEWMDQYQSPEDGAAYEIQKSFYLSEKTKVITVKEIMENAISKGNEYIQSHKSGATQSK